MSIDLKALFLQSTEADKAIHTTLLKAMAANKNTPMDYITFKQSVQKMIEMGLDLETSHKSAFATASTMGLSKEALLKSVNSYKVVLQKEKEKFAESLKGQIAKKIDGKILETEKIKKAIESNRKKIENLQKEIELYESKLAGMDNVVEENKAKIIETRDRFKTTYDDLITKIDDDLMSIDKYL